MTLAVWNNISFHVSAKLGLRSVPSRQAQMGSLFAILLVVLVVNLSGKHSLLVLSSLFNLGSALALLSAVDGGLYTAAGRKKLLTEAELPTFSMDAVFLNILSTSARLVPLVLSPKFRIPGALFLGISDSLALGFLVYLWSRRKEFPLKEASVFYYALAVAVFMFSFPFRAGLARSFALDSLWTWGACLEPLVVVPQCVAVLLSSSSKDGLSTGSLLTYPFPPLAAVARLVSAVAAVIYWLYTTNARRGEYRLISGLLLLLQVVGVCGAVLVAALSLKAEIQKRKLHGNPLLSVVIVTKGDSVKAL
jgi:hypothetical protein